MTKRIVSLILLVCMLVNILPPNLIAEAQSASSNMKNIELLSKDTNPFKDVNEKDWFYDSVVYVLEQGIFMGTGDDTFSPYGTMTRGMYLTLIGRIAGVDPNHYKDSGFIDVDNAAYYAPYVAWAVQNGITQGVGNNRFNPNGIVSREQMATLTVRFFEVNNISFPDDTGVTEEPKDLGDVAAWAQEAVLKLWKAGLFKGSNGKFNPKSDANRAEAAALTTRINKTVIEWKETKNEHTSTPTPTPTPTTPTTPSGPSGPSGPSTPPAAKKYTIKFDSQGGSLVESIVFEAGKTIDDLPIPEKDGSIFIGWFEEPSLMGNPVDGAKIINSDLTLYAKYLEITGINEEILNNSFSLAEQESGLTFKLVSSDNRMTPGEVELALILENASGPEEVELEVTGSNGNFSVKAKDGFTEGSSYKLTLDDDRLSFADRDEQEYICSFTISKEEVFNLEFNDGIKYISINDVDNIIKDNTSVGSLSVPVMTLGGGDNDTSTNGSFTYNGNEKISIGDTLCIYSGDKPTAEGNEDLTQGDIAYIKVIGVSEAEIEFSEAESKDVLLIPDIIPIDVGTSGVLTNYENDGQAGYFKALLSNLDFGSEDYQAIGLSADTTIDKGDYLMLINSSSDEVDESEISYVRVSSVKVLDDIIEVKFESTTTEEMLESTSYYSKNDVSGDQMIEDLDLEKIQSDIEKQLQENEFGDKVATYLTSLAISTDGFVQMADANGGLDSLRIIMEDGSDVGIDQFKMLAKDSKKIEIKKKDFKVNINKKPKNFNDGIHCEIKVSLEIEIKAGDGNSIVINLDAGFIEEIKLTVNASGQAIWAWETVKVFGKRVPVYPYIDDYIMSADIDIYNYTAVSFKARVSSKSDDGSIDISEQIQKILSKNSKENEKEITNGVKELYEIYSDMMANSTDWMDIFDVTILDLPMSLLSGVIQIRVTVNFVAAANINVAIGCNFETKSATRYTFWAKLEEMNAGTGTVSLMDETYTFQFYVMGVLGLKTGIKLEVAVGLFSLKLDSVGIEAGAGLFTRLYGFFFYEKKLENKKVSSNKSGALYFELGAYLEVALKAQVLNGKYKYNPTILDKEFVLLTAGDRYTVFDFDYEDNDIEEIILSEKSNTYSLPNDAFNMTYLDLREGEKLTKAYGLGDYNIRFSDNRFSIKDNKIVANVPSNVQKLEADMIVTWKHSPLAFSSVPISRKYSIVWDNIKKEGYIITFDSGGGSHVNSMTKKYDETISTPKTPTKMGYTFAGWYTDKELKNEYKFTKMGWNNITLYAKWVPSKDTKYTVEYHHEDIGDGKVIKLPFGIKIKYPMYTLAEKEVFTGTTDSIASPVAKTFEGFTAPSATSSKIKPDGSTLVIYVYKRNSYNLTYKLENGESNIVKTLEYKEGIKPPVPTKTGHTFLGWDTEVVEKMPAKNTTYTAIWQKNKYRVFFDTNGGTDADLKIVEYGDKYCELPISTKTGYTFAGWYTNEIDDMAMGNKVEDNSTANITSNQILYAKWEANQVSYKVEHYKENLDGKYVLVDTEELTGTTGESVTPEVKTYTGFTAPETQTVTILADGSTVVRYEYTRNSYKLTFKQENETADIVNQVKYESIIVPPTDLVKLGYTFDGWNPSVAEKMPAKDVTYTAKWTVANNIPYKVEHYKENLNGNYDLLAPETEELTGTTGESVTPEVKTYTGFTAPVAQTVTIKADGTTLVKYEYKRNSYKLTFKPENETADIVNQVKYEDTITLPLEPVKLGYTFVGWNPSVAEKMPAEDVTFIAKWTVANNIPYKVEHYKENLNGNYDLLAPETEELTGTTGESVTPEVKTYTGFTAPETQTVTILADGTTVVEYKYTRNSYKLTFVLGNGENDTVNQVKYESIIVPPTDLIKAGYIFDGWNPAVAEKMPEEDVTFIAKWTVANNIPYKVEHYKENLNGNYDLLAPETEELTGTTGESVTPEVKTYTGFTAPSAQTVTILADGTTVVEYKYTRNSYKLTFKQENETADIVNQVKYEGTIILPTSPTRAGYSFAGWNPELAPTMPAGDMTYIAQWTANEVANYTVEYYTQDLDSINYTLEEKVPSTGIAGTTITPIVKEISGFTAPSAQTVTIETGGSTVVRYEYARNNYVLTFKSGNGDADAVITAKYGADITIPSNLERTGYTFAGWGPAVASTMPAEDTTYTAQWTANKYNVTFDSNDGKICDDIVVTYDSPYGELPTPTLDDYTFLGWYDGEIEGNGSGNLITSSTTVSIAGSHILYAKWELNNTVGIAEDAVNTVQVSQRHEDFVTAQDLVTALSNEGEKVRLQGVLDDIVIIYNLALANGKRIEIRPTYCVHNETRIDYVSKKFAFVITGSSTGSTPLQIYDELDVPVVYDITLRDANIIASSWATAVRFDSKNSDNSLVINLRIEGNVKIEADNHSGIQGSGYSTINLSGTANSTLNCGARQSSAGRAIGERFTINIGEYNIREMKAGNVVTQNITDAQAVGNIKLNIVFQ